MSNIWVKYARHQVIFLIFAIYIEVTLVQNPEPFFKIISLGKIWT
jgi:hypothetical protein